MKIAYLVDYDIDDNNGVVQKILQQSQKWIELGQTVYYISTKTLTIYDSNKNIITRFKPLNIGLKRVGTAMKLLYNSYFLYELLENVKFDIVYMRYRLYMPFFTKVLKKYKVVMEINSDDTLEYKLHSKLTSFYNNLTRDLVLKHIDGFVCVSHELKDRFLCFKKDVEVIANGIDVSKYNIVNHSNQKPILVFIGTPNQSWHGLEKILKMAHYFVDYQFYIIGTEGADTPNIKYFGYLSQEDSTKIIQHSDVGIGTLALHKKGLTEASPLKTRQYLACGLPIIYAYKDTDMQKSMPFTLQLKNTEDDIDYDAIKSFVELVFGNHDIKKQARNFAEETLDYQVKERKRLSFFEKILYEN